MPSMIQRRRFHRGLTGLLALSWAGQAFAQSTGIQRMNATARGTFKVEMKPHAEADTADGVSLGRLSLNKRFEGDLVAQGAGEMLTALTPVKGSAGYVAIERVTGTLHGRSGSFVLQHTGTMDHGAQQLAITVVPDSGTGALSGLAGRLAIRIADGQHFYDFDYTLPAPSVP